MTSQTSEPELESIAVPARRGDVFAEVTTLLCDADGNLFPSEEPAFVASAQVLNRFLAEHGVQRHYEAEELRLATTGMNFRSTVVAIALEHQIPVAPELVPAAAAQPERSGQQAAGLTRQSLDQWIGAEKEAVTEYLQTVLRPDPEVLEPLTTLAERFAVAAVSSSADARIAACFEVTGLAHFFPAERRFSAEDSLSRPISKPDPAIYLYAGGQLGLGPQQGVAIEDSVAGATSAVAAGFPTIGNLQFVAQAERADRHAALTQLGVSAIVTSWQEILDLLPHAD